jgi:hypothetical protein
VVTLILCGLVTLIPASGVSQVFISLVVSMGMMILFANCNPYLSKSDDILAQFCQLSLTFAMAVGILEKAAESFQDDLFGPLLVVSASVNLVMGIIFIASDFIVTVFPEATAKSLGALLSTDTSSRQLSTARELKHDMRTKIFPRKTAVAPVTTGIVSDPGYGSDFGEDKDEANDKVASRTQMQIRAPSKTRRPKATKLDEL